MRTDPAGAETGIIARVADFAGMRVLEVGGGDGRMTVIFSGQANSVLSIDTDAELIALANEKSAEPGHANVEYRVGDICVIKLQPGEFDIVFLALSL